MKHITNASEVPSGTHYAILEFSSIHIPGDERSRTNPGHGYDAHSVSRVQYTLFENKEEWEAEITRRTTDSRGLYVSSDEFVPVTITRAKVKTTVEVTVEEGEPE